jgi:hypothetical protein
MQAMPGTTAAASRWTLSAGTVLALGGGLVLYQMTALVLGPSGSRELHVSLRVPAIDVNQPALSLASGGNLVLGSLMAPASARVSGRPAAEHRAPSRPVAHRSAAPVAPKPTPAAKTPTAVPPLPVGSKDTPPNEKVGEQNQHESD